MRRASIIALFAATVTAAASAEPLPALEVAQVYPKGTWSFGVFAPISVGLGNGFELRGHPLLFLAAPNAVLRKQLYSGSSWTITAEAGALVPTLLFRLTQGYLFPTWFQGQRQIGWMVVPSLGAVATLGSPAESPFTLSADGSVGLTLSRNDATTLGTYAPLEVATAAALGGWRVHGGAQYNRLVMPGFRARGYADAYVYGATLGTQVAFRAGLAIDVRLFGESNRLTAGAVWWNSNQYRRDLATGQFVRSNDFYPTVDFIWMIP